MPSTYAFTLYLELSKWRSIISQPVILILLEINLPAGVLQSRVEIVRCREILQDFVTATIIKVPQLIGIAKLIGATNCRAATLHVLIIQQQDSAAGAQLLV